MWNTYDNNSIKSEPAFPIHRSHISLYLIPLPPFRTHPHLKDSTTDQFSQNTHSLPSKLNYKVWNSKLKMLKRRCSTLNQTMSKDARMVLCIKQRKLLLLLNLNLPWLRVSFINKRESYHSMCVQWRNLRLYICLLLIHTFLNVIVTTWVKWCVPCKILIQ